MPEPDVHDLPEETRRFFAARLSAIQQLLQQMQGAAAYYCETHGLEGQWQLSEDGARLIRMEPHPPKRRSNE